MHRFIDRLILPIRALRIFSIVLLLVVIGCDSGPTETPAPSGAASNPSEGKAGPGGNKTPDSPTGKIQRLPE